MNRLGRSTGPTGSPLSGSDVLVAAEGAGCVLLHVPSGTYLRLDRSATEIFHLVQERGAESAAAHLVTHYGIDRQTADADVASIVRAVRSAQSTRQNKARRPELRGGIRVSKEWMRLSARAKLYVAIVGLSTAGVEVALRVLSIGTVSRLVGAPLGEGQGDEANLPEVNVDQLSPRQQLSLASIEWVLQRWVYDGTCLRKALLSGIALRGRRPSLRIGLIENGSDLAHAWLRCDTFTLGSLPGGVRTFSQSA